MRQIHCLVDHAVTYENARLCLSSRPEPKQAKKSLSQGAEAVRTASISLFGRGWRRRSGETSRGGFRHWCATDGKRAAEDFLAFRAQELSGKMP
jgi:hypothetical protein